MRALAKLADWLGRKQLALDMRTFWRLTDG
jgi:hypothetical protein